MLKTFIKACAPVEHVLARLLRAATSLALVLLRCLQSPIDLPVLCAEHRLLLLEELMRLGARL